MAIYRISGVWQNANNVITHYAMHLVAAEGTARARKVPKAEAVALVEHRDNTATTWMWNYQQSRWVVGENVEVVNGVSGKFLRSNPDNRVSDNLQHLIDYDWIAP